MSKLMHEIVKELLISKGPITFADYMQTVLYHPRAGYYTTKDNIFGSKGDFYTSANVGNLFGSVLGEVYLKESLTRCFVNVMEYGAGEGKIANAFLDYVMESCPDIYSQITYFIVEISRKLRDKQQANLTKHFHKVKWVDSIGELAPFTGMIFANEFIDALPVHILKYSRNEIKEQYLVWQNGKLHKMYRPLSPEVHNWVHLIPSLPNGSFTEFNTQAIDWLEEISASSKEVTIFLIDYGYAISKSFSQKWTTSVRCFKNHKVLANPFAQMGERDITADVDFTALQKAALQFGYVKHRLTTQSKFILESGLFEKMTKGKDFSRDDELEHKIRGLKQLIFPGAMGEIFKVLKLYK